MKQENHIQLQICSSYTYISNVITKAFKTYFHKCKLNRSREMLRLQVSINNFELKRQP